MTSQSGNSTGKLATNSKKEVFIPSSSKPMSAERAARFLDTQEEFLESLAIRPERNKKEYEEKRKSSILPN